MKFSEVTKALTRNNYFQGKSKIHKTLTQLLQK